MPETLSVLVVEDSENDARLILQELRSGQWDVQSRRVQTREDMTAALNSQSWDLIIADHSMPQFSGHEALAMARARSVDIPFILVSGKPGENTAVEAIKAGADDYLFKGDLKRLVPAVQRELRDRDIRSKARNVERQFHDGQYQLAEAQAMAHLGTWFLDLGAGTACCSDEACEILGCPGDRPITTTEQFLSKLKPADRAVLMDHLQSPDRKQVEHDCSIGTGSCERFVHIRGRFTRDPDGRAVEATGMIQDITERHLIDLQLEKAKAEADNANRAKSAFLANMSHEIRTPLTAIVGFADMMARPADPNTPDRAECVAVIRRNAHHLLELISEILDLSKIEAGQLTTEAIRFDLPGLISELTLLMRPRAVESALEFKTTFTGPIPRHVTTDPLKLRQILVNLIGNAIKFTSAGKVEMKVSCDTTGADGTLRIDVSDTGIGMTAEQLGAIFEPFNQGDKSITRKYGGTGLGLTISRRLAKLLGGDIVVSSQVGAGSVFSVTINTGPIDRADCIDGLTETTLPTAEDNHRTDDVRIAGRVLLAEDGRDNQRLLSTHIKTSGGTVVVAENGQVALDLFAAEPFDLVLMDMQMPVMDGYTAAAEFRRRGIRVPIIALTAHAMSEDREKCLASGCDDYMTKPVERAAFLRKLQQYLPAGDRSPCGTVDPPPPPIDGTMSIRACIASSMWDVPGMAPIIVEFVQTLPDEVASLSRALEARQMDSLRRQVHQLRGACGGYGFDGITEVAAAAEEAIKRGDDHDAIRRGISALIDIIRTIEGFDGASKRQAA